MPLTQKDRKKLLNAGFQILRREENRLLIKICNNNNNWEVLKKCSSKKELNEVMNQLIEMHMCIEDR
ncbi:MAG: hypothetical protein Kow00102_14190 [Spirochaetota bacterium]|nr:hypothetical protein [Spirochaetota bacterium]